MDLISFDLDVGDGGVKGDTPKRGRVGASVFWPGKDLGLISSDLNSTIGIVVERGRCFGFGFSVRR